MKQRTITERNERRDRVFGSSAFTDVIFARRRETASKCEKAANSKKSAEECKKTAAGGITLCVEAPSVAPSQTLRIAGSCEALGDWNPALAPELDDSRFPLWSISFGCGELPAGFEYKFIVCDRSDGRLLAWEEGWNRRFDYLHGDDEHLTVETAPFVNPVRWRGAGTAIPVFSLRSEKSFGCGEFADLKLMADWAAATGQHLVQILPVNDTTSFGSWRDSYPYNANSIFALHPQYIRPEAAGRLSDDSARRRFARLRRELNALPEVDYERVNAAKHEYLRLLYAEQGAADLASAEYRDFFDKNAAWLKPYAVYCVLRDRLHTADFRRWGRYAEADAQKIDNFIKRNREAVGYWFFLQYHLDRQLREARNYAHAKGVVLKGDIPIGISRTSVDAWSNPRLFRMQASAGAPPDDFAVKGQNWGFPTYDWERMAADGYAWWRARFVKMNDFFDAYRIDHILGFFRIWEIPRTAVSALLGRFNPAMPLSPEEIASYGFRFDPALHTAPVEVTDDVLFVEDTERRGLWHPRITAQKTACYEALAPSQQEAFNRLYDDFFYRRHNEWWRTSALRKLVPLVSSTRMLVCGEDLGMIPACVPEVMEELQILSLEIERMPKQTGVEFGDPHGYPYLSVSSPSTHDMSNLRLWWSEDRERTERYCRGILGCEPTEECTPAIAERLLRRQLESGSMLAVIPLQDWLATDAELRRDDPAAERINVPANPDQYWNYRMHITLEQLLSATAFNLRLRKMIEEIRN